MTPLGASTEHSVFRADQLALVHVVITEEAGSDEAVANTSKRP